jgi:hypothetical protein
MLNNNDLNKQVSLLAANDPVLKRLQEEIKRLEGNLARMTRERQEHLGERRRSVFADFWYSVVTSAARVFIPEVFTRARIQAPLLMPPPAPPQPSLVKKPLAKSKQIESVDVVDNKQHELVRKVLGLFKNEADVENLVKHGDKIAIKVSDGELDVMLPREALSEKMILDVMIEKFKERQEQALVKFKEQTILGIVSALEKNNMISTLDRSNKNSSQLLQEATGLLKKHRDTLPEVKSAEEAEAPKSLSASDRKIVEKANALREKNAGRRKIEIVESAPAVADSLGFNELALVLKEISNRIEQQAKQDPGYFTKANISKVATLMSTGRKAVGEQEVEVARKCSLPLEKISKICSNELTKVRKEVRQVGEIVIKNEVTPAAPAPQLPVEIAIAIPLAAPEVTPQPEALSTTAMPQEVQAAPAVEQPRGLLARLFGSKAVSPEGAGRSK